MENGIHLLLDWYGSDPDVIGDAHTLLELLVETATVAECKIVGTQSYQFTPYGSTAVVLLAESHISAHHSPEHDYISIDIYTCMASMMPFKALEFLKTKLKPKIAKTNQQERG